MTDLDDLLAEVSIRTDGSRHWTGGSDLALSDAELAKELAAAVRALRDRPCPHIETGDDGTAFCTLAEAANTAWAARAERAEGVLDRIRALDVSGATYADIGAAVTVILRESLAVSVRPGGTDNPTSDPIDRYEAYAMDAEGWGGGPATDNPTDAKGRTHTQHSGRPSRDAAVLTYPCCGGVGYHFRDCPTGGDDGR